MVITLDMEPPKEKLGSTSKTPKQIHVLDRTNFTIHGTYNKLKAKSMIFEFFISI